MCGRESKDANMQRSNVKCTFSILLNNSLTRFLTMLLFHQVGKVTFDVKGRQTVIYSLDVCKEVCSSTLIDKGSFLENVCTYVVTSKQLCLNEERWH
jgi:hypothetical protein